MHIRLLLAVCIALALCQFCPADSYAKPKTELSQEDRAREMQRLADEIEKLAVRNHWVGVERVYTEMLDLDIGIDPEHRIMASQGATHRGDMLLAHSCLSAAIPPDYDPEVAGEEAPKGVQEAYRTLKGLEGRYGRVNITVGAGRVPALVRFQMPFTREERKSIEYGRETLASERQFAGFLPVGRYMVDGQFFDVAPGNDIQEIIVGTLDE